MNYNLRPRRRGHHRWRTVGTGWLGRGDRARNARSATRRPRPTTRWPSWRGCRRRRAVRIEAMRDMLAGGQAELHRGVNERLDLVTHHLSQSMTHPPAYGREPAELKRTVRGHRRRAEEHHRPVASQVTSLNGVLGNKQARRLGQATHGNDRRGWAAEGLLRIPDDALEPQPAGLRDLPARQSAAGDRRQVPARSRHGVPRGQERRRAQAGRVAGAPGSRPARRRYRGQVPDTGRDRRIWR